MSGSTAFQPVAPAAAKFYQDSRPGASFSFDMRGSGEGLQAVDQASLDSGAAGMLAFADGEKPDGMPESLAASFLRYLTNQVGADIIRSHGDRPCAELANPQLCRPT